MGEIRPNHYNSVKDLLVANRGLLQAAGSWSVDACCAVPGNDCHSTYCHDLPGRHGPGPGVTPCSGTGCDYCWDRTSSSDWLFGLWPGPPQRFEPTGTDTTYQVVYADYWPSWGSYSDLSIIGIGSGGRGPRGALIT